MKVMKTVPEECHLCAYWSGDGWQLSVEDEKYETLCYLKWPAKWPKSMTRGDLERFGFIVI